MRRITKRWLIEHSSSNTETPGWTREQLALIGVAWPPKTPWARRVEGMLIEDDVAEKFEELGRGRRFDQPELKLDE